MVCKKCGASLLSEDQFCPECGAKVIRKRRCPECGETLREGIRFCPSCGAEVGEDMPKRKADPEAPRKKANAAPPPKKRPVRDERPPRRRDWEDDDWDDEDEDDDEESVDVLSIMTVAVGCILLVILVVLGFKMYQRYVPKNYDKAASEQEEEQSDEMADEEEQGDGQRLEDPAEEEEAESETVSIEGTIITVSDVRIRDNPSTQGTTVITTAKKGDTFEYSEVVEGGHWYKILLPEEYGYEYGYVSADYVEPQ